MKSETYGIIPLAWRDNAWQVLAICNRDGHWWGFPKGHSEPDESHQTTAERELHEETGLSVTRFLPYPPLHESYTFTRDSQTFEKIVTYFLAEVHGVLTPDVHEIAHAEWLSLQDAESRMSYPEGADLVRRFTALIS